MAPRSLCKIEEKAFLGCSSLRHVDLNACRPDLHKEHGTFLSTRVFEDSGLESIVLPLTLSVIEDRAFFNCKRLRSVTVSTGSKSDSDVAAFIAPTRLRKIGSLAFCGCTALKKFRLNRNTKELGWLCLWNSGIKELKFSKNLGKTLEQLGFGQHDTRLFRLPNGLKFVGSGMFEHIKIRTLIVPSNV